MNVVLQMLDDNSDDLSLDSQIVGGEQAITVGVLMLLVSGMEQDVYDIFKECIETIEKNGGHAVARQKLTANSD